LQIAEKLNLVWQSRTVLAAVSPRALSRIQPMSALQFR
jgi:hypothetical protein